MPFSHRELRARRDLRRLGLVLGFVLIVGILVATYGPSPAINGLALLAVAIAGFVVVARGQAVVTQFEDDLRSVAQEGEAARGHLVAEVRNRIAPGASPVLRRARSPHSRDHAGRATRPSDVVPPAPLGVRGRAG